MKEAFLLSLKPIFWKWKQVYCTLSSISNTIWARCWEGYVTLWSYLDYIRIIFRRNGCMSVSGWSLQCNVNIPWGAKITNWIDHHQDMHTSLLLDSLKKLAGANFAFLQQSIVSLAGLVPKFTRPEAPNIGKATCSDIKLFFCTFFGRPLSNVQNYLGNFMTGVAL